MTPALPTVPADVLTVHTFTDPDTGDPVVDFTSLTPGDWDMGADGRISLQLSINGNLSYITFDPTAMLTLIASAIARGRQR